MANNALGGPGVVSEALGTLTQQLSSAGQSFSRTRQLNQNRLDLILKQSQQVEQHRQFNESLQQSKRDTQLKRLDILQNAAASSGGAGVNALLQLDRMQQEGVTLQADDPAVQAYIDSIKVQSKRAPKIEKVPVPDDPAHVYFYNFDTGEVATDAHGNPIVGSADTSTVEGQKAVNDYKAKLTAAENVQQRYFDALKTQASFEHQDDRASQEVRTSAYNSFIEQLNKIDKFKELAQEDQGLALKAANAMIMAGLQPSVGEIDVARTVLGISVPFTRQNSVITTGELSVKGIIDKNYSYSSPSGENFTRAELLVPYLAELRNGGGRSDEALTKMMDKKMAEKGAPLQPGEGATNLTFNEWLDDAVAAGLLSRGKNKSARDALKRMTGDVSHE